MVGNMENKAGSHFKDAKEKFHKRDVEGAIQELNQAIQIDPKNLEYILLRGDYLFLVGSNTSRLAASGSIAEAKQAG